MLLSCLVLVGSPFLELVRLALPRMANARWNVAVAKHDRQRYADQRGGQMGLPGDHWVKRQYPPNQCPIHESDQKRGGNGATVPSKHAGHKNVAGKAIDQSARTDMDATSAEKPDRDNVSQAHRRQHAKGRARIEVQHRRAQDKQWQRVGDQVSEVGMQQRRNENAGHPDPFTWTDAKTLQLEPPPQ